ncbi:SDR family NAD(P)-dependent oxidoreductase [Acetanaerobacterium elongatum]|uniref:NAD(P)-dependent dehydrogenase, short-chain alcohol dehydrogenase family n=1 Tax=Acetanaerobacterium elongatum TaxID=258515 RepID=A0A1H0F7Y3_9FIRM|nr:SDR family oxidoreductase [Acetanaerobacterium elongatum]SDN90754.1 NAD(P)-dependent dehydrogenase, short-chain alcohol dehydrogenase family [Acetanaerobacterium elongatum]
MVIENTNLAKGCLNGSVVLMTGGGGGIGYEASRALVWLGATVIIAEINREAGQHAADRINAELNTDRACFYPMDISKDEQVDALYTFAVDKFGGVDVLFHNATVTPVGAVDTLSIEDWDTSYGVNLRAPVMLTKRFLPQMMQRNRGTIVFVPSSGAAPYMGAYEVFKTAQVELCNTLAGELEDADIITYSIGPGLVKTATAVREIQKVAALMGLSPDEFYKMNESKMLDEETAGVGFAVSVAMAQRYRGQEIGSIQALIDAGVYRGEDNGDTAPQELTPEQFGIITTAARKLVQTFTEQYTGWFERNVFERQWVLRDFKKTTGMSADEMKGCMDTIKQQADTGDAAGIVKQAMLMKKLKQYYEHQCHLLQGYEKNPQKLRENSEIIQGWIKDVDTILSLLR